MSVTEKRAEDHLELDGVGRDAAQREPRMFHHADVFGLTLRKGSADAAEIITPHVPGRRGEDGVLRRNELTRVTNGICAPERRRASSGPKPALSDHAPAVAFGLYSHDRRWCTRQARAWSCRHRNQGPD